MADSGKRSSEAESPLGEGAVDEVVLEESSAEDDGSVGLELDARQAVEIRQIFLTTLPDYLEPIRQLVDKITSGDDADGETARTLTKTLVSMAAAATRVGIEDVQLTLETLREDVLLLHDAPDPGPLKERIFSALAELDELAASAAGAPRNRGETLVAAFRTLSGVDPSALERLVGAGVVFVEQVLQAEPSEVAAVSGLDLASVEQLIAALASRHAAPDAPPSPAREAEPAPAEEPDLLRRLAERQVEDELALDEMRAEVLRSRLRVQSLKAELVAAEQRRDELTDSVAALKQRIAEKLGALSRVEARRSELERDVARQQAELARRRAQVETLEAERQLVGDEQSRLAGEVASLSRRVDVFLRGHPSSDGNDSSPGQNALWREVG